MTVRGVSREAAIADYGVMLNGDQDEDVVSYADVDEVGS